MFAQRGSEHDWVADSATIHRLARGASSRAERECNEDLGCRKCDGAGQVHMVPREPSGGCPDIVETCKVCDGTGSQLGKRDRNAAKRAAEIAKRYGFRLYEQSDPRGCPYYLIPEEAVPTDFSELDRYTYDSERAAQNFPAISKMQGRWIDSNYSSVGTAVHP